MGNLIIERLEESSSKKTIRMLNVRFRSHLSSQ